MKNILLFKVLENKDFNDFYFPIVGLTNRVNGFVGFNPIPVNTSIYQLSDGRIFICQTRPNEPYLYPVVYYKDSLNKL